MGTRRFGPLTFSRHAPRPPLAPPSPLVIITNTTIYTTTITNTTTTALLAAMAIRIQQMYHSFRRRFVFRQIVKEVRAARRIQPHVRSMLAKRRAAWKRRVDAVVEDTVRSSILFGNVRAWLVDTAPYHAAAVIQSAFRRHCRRQMVREFTERRYRGRVGGRQGAQAITLGIARLGRQGVGAGGSGRDPQGPRRQYRQARTQQNAASNLYLVVSRVRIMLVLDQVWYWGRKYPRRGMSYNFRGRASFSTLPGVIQKQYNDESLADADMLATKQLRRGKRNTASPRAQLGVRGSSGVDWGGGGSGRQVMVDWDGLSSPNSSRPVSAASSTPRNTREHNARTARKFSRANTTGHNPVLERSGGSSRRLQVEPHGHTPPVRRGSLGGSGGSSQRLPVGPHAPPAGALRRGSGVSPGLVGRQLSSPTNGPVKRAGTTKF